MQRTLSVYDQMYYNVERQDGTIDTADQTNGVLVIPQNESLQYCKPVTILSHEAQRKFIEKYCPLLKNRSNDQHVCMS